MEKLPSPEQKAFKKNIEDFPQGMYTSLPDLETLRELATKAGESCIYFEVKAQQRADGWYVNFPNGTTERIASFDKSIAEHPPKDLFIVVPVHGDLYWSHGKPTRGVEFYSSPTRHQQKDISL